MRYLSGYRWRRMLVLTISFLALSSLCNAQEPPKPKPHGRVVLITFDALRPEVYRDAVS